MLLLPLAYVSMLQFTNTYLKYTRHLLMSRNRNSDSRKIACVRKNALGTRTFSMKASEFLIFLQTSPWLPCFLLGVLCSVFQRKVDFANSSTLKERFRAQNSIGRELQLLCAAVAGVLRGSIVSRITTEVDVFQFGRPLVRVDEGRNS